jgi:hypothetical protein
MAGIQVEARVTPETTFAIETKQFGDFHFSAEKLLREGRIVFPIGAKYSHCTIIVTRDDFFWFRDPQTRNEVTVEATEMSGADLVDFSRMKQVWIEAGQSASFDIDIPALEADDREGRWRVHLQAMTAKDREDPYALSRDYMPLEIRKDESVLMKARQFFRYHDVAMQILHDVWGEIPFDQLPLGRHTLEIRNCHSSLPLLVNRISFRAVTWRHLEICAPDWALVDEEIIIRVRTLHPDCRLRLEFQHSVFHCAEGARELVAASPGIHEFRVIAMAAAMGATLRVLDSGRKSESSVTIGAIFDVPREVPEVKVGYDMTTVPHDDCGIMDWLLDYTQRTKLGNLVCFRPFPMGMGAAPELLTRWAEFCRYHHLYVQGINVDARPLAEAAKEYFHAAGNHELSGALYFTDPDNKSQDMRNAAERYVAFVAETVSSLRKDVPKVAFGDASGGHRYSLIAGADFLRAETMVAHTMNHLSQARGAALALGSGEWGVHIAIQHAKQPYLESHLGQYYLSLMQPWMMGASFIYEEDSLFLLFKEERQTWDDLLTRGKRDMTRDFFRFVSTHPRSGQPEIQIAYLQGRYAAPFNGFICGSEQDPTYSVWGKFGRSDNAAWGHLQPEKSQQLLDCLMPGASTHPLRQKFEKRRFFFSGTPYGDFDQAPMEASSEFLMRYRLLLHLGWNTMIADDYSKLSKFVSNGGILLVGIPQFSAHVKRDFLLTMEDLNLFCSGDISDLTGVSAVSRGLRFSGKWRNTDDEFAPMDSLSISRYPSSSPDEDGPCYVADIELRGAEVVIEDAETCAPLLTRFRKGRGAVYLLTTWAYPGHEELAELMATVIQRLCERVLCEYRIEDSHEEVFWTWWPDIYENCGRLMGLNTDWTVANAEKNITIVTPALRVDTIIRERQALLITCIPFGIIVPGDTEPFIQIADCNSQRAELQISAEGTHHFHIHLVSQCRFTAPGITMQLAAGANEITLRWQETTVLRCVLEKAGQLSV